nr:hypothetical protein CFP56_67824 [Quercus suber]
METLQPVSAIASQTNLHDPAPHTPPFTPARGKRRLERSDSPASSIHPTETCSPAKKIVKRTVSDHVKVEELKEGDVGYQTDVEVIYPQELEEAESNSDGDDEMSSTDADDPDELITRRLSRMCYDDRPEADFEKERRRRHLMRRAGDRASFKRSHSQSLKSDDMDFTTDLDAMDDHDLTASQRRLRRRVRGPRDAEVVYEEVLRSSPEPGMTTAAPLSGLGGLATPPSTGAKHVPAEDFHSAAVDVEMSED